MGKLIERGIFMEDCFFWKPGISWNLVGELFIVTAHRSNGSIVFSIIAKYFFLFSFPSVNTTTHELLQLA